MLADDDDRPAVVRQHRGGGVRELDRQEQRAGDVPELLVLAGRADVEDHGPEREEALGLVGRHVLVRSRAAVYSGRERGHDGAMIRPARGGASARDHAGERVMAFPALFVSHGAPTAALDDDAYTRALGAWARGRPKPRAIVVVSAHAEARGPVRVNAGARPALIYDFYGFPSALYALRYPAPGAPDLAREVAGAFANAGLDPVVDAQRGWDHGVWVPLRLLYPAADVPVVGVSLPVPRTPDVLLAMGRALAPLRERGVLLFGSGGLVHNLHRLRPDDPVGPPEPWAAAFSAWVEERLAAMDASLLAEYEGRAPHADLAVPTSEHFDPVFFVLGAHDRRDRLESVYEGFRYGTLSLRSFALAAS